jgi:SLOG family YspA-like protein
MTRVLICGGRHFHDWAVAWHYLDALHAIYHFELVIHGGAPGADTLADKWAKLNSVPIAQFKAEWSKFGHAAGPLRNRRMLKEGIPDLVVALPGGRGTSNMRNVASRAGVTVLDLQFAKVRSRIDAQYKMLSHEGR